MAAVAKVFDRAGARRAMADLAVPGRLVPAATGALPVAEVTAAVLLVIAPTARAGASLAAVLLLIFVAAIVLALRRGATPECHCFGQLHSRPAGRQTIVRNGGLLAVSLFVLATGPGPQIDTWLSATSGQVVALAATGLLAAGLAYACASLRRDNRELRGVRSQPSRTVPLAVGQAIPMFEVTSSDGTVVTSADLVSAELRMILVFTSAACGPCMNLFPELARWRTMLRGRLEIHVLASGDAGTNRRLGEENGIAVLLDGQGSVANAFGILGTPSAVEIAATGQVATPPAMGAPAIEGAIRAALRRPAAASDVDGSTTPLHPERARAVSGARAAGSRERRIGA